MKLGGLTPDAHGTLQALERFGALRIFDEGSAVELDACGYAEIRRGRLVITDAGHAAAAATRRAVPSAEA